MERNGKPCYANNIASKSSAIRVIRTALINMTAPSCFTKKWVLELLQKRHIDNFSKESIVIALWTDFEGILSQIALYPITGLIIQIVNKNVFILILSQTEVVKKLAY